jgi:2-phosphosulfolactate phosphatase
MSGTVSFVEVLIAPASYERSGPEFWEGKTVVVIDVLRATSTMVTALAEGYDWIYPCRDVERARAQAGRLSGSILAGERGGLPPEGFAKGNSPREFLGSGIRGGGIVLTTTNGTRALEAARGAETLVVASFLNLTATLKFLQQQKGSVVLICSGTGEDFALEDALLASAILEVLQPEHPLASLYRAYAGVLEEAFRSSRNGRRLVGLGLDEDIRWCLQSDRYEWVVKSGDEGFLRGIHVPGNPVC